MLPALDILCGQQKLFGGINAYKGSGHVAEVIRKAVPGVMTTSYSQVLRSSL